MLIFYYVEQHLVGNVGHEQGVSAMAVISVAQVGGHCSHNRCHRRKGRLQRKYFKNNSSFYLSFQDLSNIECEPCHSWRFDHEEEELVKDEREESHQRFWSSSSNLSQACH